MKTQTGTPQWTNIDSRKEDYPIRERFPRLHTWKPLPPLGFSWKMKPLSSARTEIKLLKNRQFELTLSHDLIKGVTPQMLHWWFCHIDNTMEYEGQTCHRYRIWHPFDHIHYRDLSRTADGAGSAGTRRHIVEAFGGNTRYLVNIIDRVVHLDDKGVLLSTEQAGVSAGFGNLLVPVPFRFSSLEHQFIPGSNGTRYESRLLIGLDSKIGRYFVNPVIRPMIIGYEMARAWLTHNVEEVGNFEYFLPELYRTFNS